MMKGLERSTSRASWSHETWQRGAAAWLVSISLLLHLPPVEEGLWDTREQGVDDLVNGVRIEVSRICQELDVVVEYFLSRPWTVDPTPTCG